MGDFLISFANDRTGHPPAPAVAAALHFSEDTTATVYEQDTLRIQLSRPDGFALWGPYAGATEAGPIWVGLAGRVSLSAAEWAAGQRLAGPGGDACKAIYARYQSGGLQALLSLSGNYAVFVHDVGGQRLHLLTDPAGMYLAYVADRGVLPLLVGSHPDVVASFAGAGRQLDRVSLAEFVRTGCLTYPHTYYENIRALPFGRILTFNLRAPAQAPAVGAPAVALEPRINSKTSEWELAEELAAKLGDSVRRRTLPVLGTTGLGLSGGLDSRAILAAVDQPSRLVPFFLLDEENAECRVARAIADAADLPLHELRREFDYYGASAAQGVRISGGTGNIASNHYLSSWTRLKALGVTNLITGCYCDYLFKALAANRIEQRIRRRETLHTFALGFYRPLYPLNSPFNRQVDDRLHARFPEVEGSNLSDEQWLSVETRRTFPLAYESDLAQRVIPQRTMPWSAPMVDNALLELHQRIPSRFKLNAALFRKAMSLMCPRKFLAIPDNNTGAPVMASGLSLVLRKYHSALLNRLASRFRPGIASRGSWPNWAYYVAHSELVRATWQAPVSGTRDVLCAIMGADHLSKPPSAYTGHDLELFLRLWTLKIWLDQRQ